MSEAEPEFVSDCTMCMVQEEYTIDDIELIVDTIMFTDGKMRDIDVLITNRGQYEESDGIFIHSLKGTWETGEQ